MAPMATAWAGASSGGAGGRGPHACGEPERERRSAAVLCGGDAGHAAADHRLEWGRAVCDAVRCLTRNKLNSIFQICHELAMTQEKKSENSSMEHRTPNKLQHEFEETVKRTAFECARSSLIFIKEFPLAAVGMLSTGVGVLVMYAYFQSIEYLPSEIGALFALGGLSFVTTAAFVTWIFIAFAAPMWVYQRELSLPGIQSNQSISRRKVDWRYFGLQVGGAGLALVIASVHLLSVCITLSYLPLAFGLSLLAWGAVSAWDLTIKTIDTFDDKLQRLGVCVMVTVMAFVAVTVIINIVLVNSGPSILASIIIVGVWLVFILASAWFVIRGSALIWSILVLSFLPLLLVVVPGVLGNGYYLPNRVAELSGVRDRDVKLLLVNPSSCELIVSAVSMMDEVVVSPPLRCNNARAWTPVYAQVLSTVGTRWLIQIYGASDDALGPRIEYASVRLTLPSDSVQRVQALPARKVVGNCKSTW
jgi:hypothetical protein